MDYVTDIAQKLDISSRYAYFIIHHVLGVSQNLCKVGCQRN